MKILLSFIELQLYRKQQKLHGKTIFQFTGFYQKYREDFCIFVFVIINYVPVYSKKEVP